MKAFFVLIFLITPLFTLAQQLIHVEQKNNGNIDYLEFSSDSCSPVFIKKMNKSFGYQQTLIDTYNEAPNFDEKKLTANEILKMIDSIKSGKKDGSLASIEYNITFNESYLLTFKKIVLPEGENKITNSTMSDYPYVFPKIFDFKHEKEIKSIKSFLTSEGIKSIQKTLQKVICKRVKLYLQNKSDFDCRMGTYSLDEYMNKAYVISNNPSDNDIFGASEAMFFNFNFTETGLEFENNEMDIKSIVCVGPYSCVTIPWFDLQPYCINKPDNIIKEICNSRIKKMEKSEWIVKSDFANLLDTPDELGLDPPERVKPYIIKGEKVYAIAVSDKYLKVKYISGAGKEITGWVQITDIE